MTQTLSPLHAALERDIIPTSAADQQLRQRIQSRIDAKLVIARQLIENGADIEEVAFDGLRPLHRAVRYKHRDIVELLLNRGAKINSTTDYSEETYQRAPGATGQFSYRYTPLFMAVCNNDYDLTRYLLKKGADWRIMTSDESFPLYVACQLGYSALVGLLLDEGADPNMSDSYGWTPLLVAITYDHINAVQLLLEHGANPETKNRHGQAPLPYAKMKFGEDSPIVELLASFGATNEDACDDVERSLMEEAQAELERGIEEHDTSIESVSFESGVLTEKHEYGSSSLGSTDNPLDSPIHALIYMIGGFGLKFSIESIEQLMDVANVSVNDSLDEYFQQGISLLYYACSQNRIDVVKSLIARGADVNQPQDNGATPLFCAAELGLVSIAKELIAAGALVNANKYDGTTPLYNAVMHNQINMVKLLLKSGAEAEQLIGFAQTDEIRDLLRNASSVC
jgi:ankyrin repeat protein